MRSLSVLYLGSLLCCCQDSLVESFSNLLPSRINPTKNERKLHVDACEATLPTLFATRHRRQDDSSEHNGELISRRQMIYVFLASSSLIHANDACATGSNNIMSPHPFVYSENWIGTTLPLLTLEQAVETATTKTSESWPMARWPDAILRRPASPVDDRWYGTNVLKQACSLLQTTANQAHAVGLAAQQCGVDARIVYLQTPGRLSSSSVVMVNPHIVERSMEQDMRVWQEHCLVLPPTFVATVLRDAWVDVEYWDWKGNFHSARLMGEVARAVQHELDHDRGILTLDHVGLEELESEVMQHIEEPGHQDRMKLAYMRDVETRFGERRYIVPLF